jgi:hypothetical protein
MFATAAIALGLIERRPADDQLEEQDNHSKHEHHGNNHSAQVKHKRDRPEDHQEHKNRREHNAPP